MGTPRPTPPPVACTRDAHVVVEIDTDKYGGETSWELRNNCNDVLLGDVAEEEYPNAGENLSGAQQRLVQRAIVPQEAHEIVEQGGGRSYKYEYCLDNAQFKFTIRDAFRDGLCCDHGRGGYRVSVNGNDMASGGEFGAEEVRVFGSCEGPAPPPAPPRPVTPAPTVAPVAGPPHVPGEKGVIEFQMYKANFTYAPSEAACFYLDAVTDEVPGDEPHACAWACSMLSSCGGFVDTIGGCFLARGRPPRDFTGDCRTSTRNVVYYNRHVAIEPVCA